MFGWSGGAQLSAPAPRKLRPASSSIAERSRHDSARPPSLGRQLRRVDAGLARLAAQLADHRVERRHVVRELGTLERDRLLVDEPAHALAQSGRRSL